MVYLIIPLVIYIIYQHVYIRDLKKDLSIVTQTYQKYKIINNFDNFISDSCLVYALKFWDANNKYLLYYDQEHVVNSTVPLPYPFLAIEKYGIDNLKKSFQDILSVTDVLLLDKYFNYIKT